MNTDAGNHHKISDLKIRAATNADATEVRTLVFRVLAEYGLEPDPETTDADLKDIEASYIKAGGMFEVIEDGEGRLLATIGLFRIDEKTCELRKMYFAREIRGRGFGKLMLERAVNHARTLGFKRIVLETASVLEEAIRLYTRFGFRPASRHHLAPRADRAYFLDLSD